MQKIIEKSKDPPVHQGSDQNLQIRNVDPVEWGSKISFAKNKNGKEE